MVAHAGDRLAGLVEPLTERLRVLQFVGGDLATVALADAFSELPCGPVCLCVDLIGDLVEGVDDAPGEAFGDALEAAVPEEIEERRHHHLDAALRLLRIRHAGVGRVVGGREPDDLRGLGEGRVVAVVGSGRGVGQQCIHVAEA
ncbi:hypothetical protein [Sphingomonas sp. AP4-R1]|uniref:hypothetical protein n=1 Tax=Sphingomonas sp. AP4-R1 TaxID=2735134 RepID=UPI0034626BD2